MYLASYCLPLSERRAHSLTKMHVLFIIVKYQSSRYCTVGFGNKIPYFMCQYKNVFNYIFIEGGVSHKYSSGKGIKNFNEQTESEADNKV